MNFHGYEFQIPDDPAMKRYFSDEAEIRDAYWDIQPGELVIDIGAGPGSYTIPALASGATVMAVEADKWAIQKLASIAALNGFTDVVFRPMACGEPYESEQLAEIPVYMRPPIDIQWASLSHLAGGRKVHWIKVDVEGGEFSVLNSGRELLERDHPKLIIEDHQTVYSWVEKHGVAAQIEELLRTLGYNWEKVPYTGCDGYRSYWVAA